MLQTSHVPGRSRGNNPVADDAIAQSRLDADRAPKNAVDGMELQLVLARFSNYTIAAVAMAIVMFLIPGDGQHVAAPNSRCTSPARFELTACIAIGDRSQELFRLTQARALPMLAVRSTLLPSSTLYSK